MKRLKFIIFINLKIFCFPNFFNGSVEVELDGLINQDNSKFIINLFDDSNTKIIPYKIFLGLKFFLAIS